MYQKDREGTDVVSAGPTRICPRHDPGFPHASSPSGIMSGICDCVSRRIIIHAQQRQIRARMRQITARLRHHSH